MESSGIPELSWTWSQTTAAVIHSFREETTAFLHPAKYDTGDKCEIQPETVEQMTPTCD